ncbi:hypothetical protein Y1Q_0007664 [Alligator mississippiensis]|uniref:Uncharacterized protein n=1 Tax=Alligator mississippiensis TaxID=8496 RepID=A0A151LY42_ALLMI|nr:hypothetical protein Y1Q_0007664 [Alligator mississippiensis]
MSRSLKKESTLLHVTYSQVIGLPRAVDGMLAVLLLHHWREQRAVVSWLAQTSRQERIWQKSWGHFLP